MTVNKARLSMRDRLTSSLLHKFGFMPRLRTLAEITTVKIITIEVMMTTTKVGMEIMIEAATTTMATTRQRVESNGPSLT